MSAFPLQVVGWPVRTQEELRELLRLHAHAGQLRRQDEHPAEAWFVSMDESPALREEVQRLVATGRPLDLLRLSIQQRQSDLVEALEHAVAAGEVPVPVVGTVAMIVARRFPGQIGRAAAAVRGLSEEHRRTFLEHAVEASPELRVRIEDALA
jgi:hypothetical protein